MPRQTTHMKEADVKPNWHVVNAEGMILGRLATEVALVLMGKHRPQYTPNVMSEQRFDPLPIEYLYAASVFYRKSRNPHGPSSRPIYAFCLEYTEFTCAMKPQGLWDSLSGKPKEPAEVFLAYFQGRGRINMGLFPNHFTDASALELLMTGICEQLGVARGKFREIGPLSLGPDCPQIA